MDNHIKQYADKLKLYNKYDTISHELIPFIYEDSTSDRLKKLKEEYNLIDIASSSSDFSTVLLLMEWVFDQLNGLGEQLSPNLNSLDILDVKQKGSLFCIHKAIVLNEVLLSVGIRSRIIRCLPHTFDCDCHVCVIVYIKEFNDWILFDPTFNTYFMDANGKPLNLIEIRKMYEQEQEPLFKHIEIDKNWDLFMNGVLCDTYDDWYTLYMAKNCFRFESPLVSSFGCMMDPNNKSVFLNPSGYTEKNRSDKHTAIYTNSVEQFLTSPYLY